MRSFYKNNGEPMTNQERLEKHPDGKCPLCGNSSWRSYFDPETFESLIACYVCDSEFICENNDNSIILTG